MTTKNRRSARLRTDLESMGKLNSEIGTHFNNVEDELTRMEDREARRAARRPDAQFPAMNGRVPIKDQVQ
ncbi:MAG: hypothetical protein QM733_15725 [Ilumatobacteraceae bacterium]